jgi:hypothetical protein
MNMAWEEGLWSFDPILPYKDNAYKKEIIQVVGWHIMQSLLAYILTCGTTISVQSLETHNIFFAARVLLR